MPKVLVIAYYTPPLGMSGVMRVTKLVKYLPRFGWEPVVLTVKKIAYFHYDEKLLEDWQSPSPLEPKGKAEAKAKVEERTPLSTFTSTLASSKVEVEEKTPHSTFTSTLTSFPIRVYRAGSLDPARIRYRLAPGVRRGEGGISRAGWLSNVLCFPDAKIGWYPFALSLGRQIVRDEKPAAIFATAPPFTTLKLGLALKREFHLPLVSDFRDPWPMGLVPPPKFRLKATQRFRHEVLEASDAVLAVNHGTAGFLEGKAEVLENGYDPDEFNPMRNDEFGMQNPGHSAFNTPHSALYRIVYVGNVWENEREFTAVLEATSELRTSNFELRPFKDIEVHLVGNVNDRMRATLARFPQFVNLGLRSHGETIAIMKGADLLLYLSKPGQAAGIKLYEYLGAGRPILSVGDECTEASRLIELHHTGEAITTDPAEIRDALTRAVQGKLDFAPRDVEHYSRVTQAERLAQILTREVLSSKS